MQVLRWMVESSQNKSNIIMLRTWYIFTFSFLLLVSVYAFTCSLLREKLIPLISKKRREEGNNLILFVLM